MSSLLPQLKRRTVLAISLYSRGICRPLRVDLRTHVSNYDNQLMPVAPPSFELLFAQAVQLMSDGEAAGAEIAFRNTLQLAPQLMEAHVNLGLLLCQRASFDEAEHHYRAAIALAPQRIEALIHFGAMLAGQKRFTEAEIVYRQALAIDAQSAEALSNLGVLLACVKREGEAEECYRSALAIAPDYRNAHFNLAYLLLRQGRFEEGWAAFESRDWYARLENHFAFPRWQGQELKGKTLMIGFEGGHGDLIQFCRYASMAKELGAVGIAIVCQPALKALFTRLAGVDEVIALDEYVPVLGWDYWTPALSFPLILRTRLDSIPADLPYLHADRIKIARFAHLTAVDRRQLRIGLAWKGNPRFENDSDRSLASLDMLAPLGEIRDARFFSLQKGPGEDEARRPGQSLAITDLSPHIGDFDDTAALIMNLDLVISVDTAVAHLAGALGKPCWVLLPAYKTDWRWLTERDDTPWYPHTMRLFRQTEAGDWTGVIAAVSAALRDFIVVTL
jgi:tetratricopeptide (TPR) repeat protein